MPANPSPPPSPRSRGTLIDHLGAAGAFGRLSVQADRLRQLQRLLDDMLPAGLLPGTHVANLKRGKVVIHAASGAVAVKLRQLSPRLAAGFNQQAHEVTGIEVRVQARRPISFGRPRRQPRTISPRTQLSLASLADGLGDDSPVRRALLKLLKNA